MIKILSILIFIMFVTGCVSHIPLSEQVPVVSYKTEDNLIIAVVDDRKRVQAGKPRTFIGVAHGVFGIPSDCEVDPWLSVEEGDDEKDLSQFLQNRIVNGLSNKGWKVSEVDLKYVPSLNEFETLIAKNHAKSLLVLHLKEWYFSLNLSWVTAFNFDTDIDVLIYTKGKGQVLSKTISERDVIDVKSTDSYQNLILMAYREQLNEILNDSSVKKALQNY